MGVATESVDRSDPRGEVWGIDFGGDDDDEEENDDEYDYKGNDDDDEEDYIPEDNKEDEDGEYKVMCPNTAPTLLKIR